MWGKCNLPLKLGLFVLFIGSIKSAQWDGLTPWFYDSTCNCNGFSNRCYFDKDLYERTGHGGHCLDCTANRDGPNCDRCRENYYQREDGFCIACNCDPTGSRTLQCNSEGRCQCKPGVNGDKCDRCEANHYDFGAQGCKGCGCDEGGSANNQPSCDPYTGTCNCKENVEGKRCKECKPGFFNIALDNEFGCTPCFCYGHSSECSSAPGYSRYRIESSFSKGIERWHAEDERGRPIEVQFNGLGQNIAVTAQSTEESVYFLAPERFLADQRASYNQLIEFTLRIGENRAIPTATDIILEGSGSYVSNTIFAQRNPIPSIQSQQYKFRLHEHPNYGWQPRLSARAFMSILTNLTAIRIRGTYIQGGMGFLDDFRLETASRGVLGKSANWIEQCECPAGYVGQFCESCSPGYRHSPSHGGPFSPCIPCDCNKHADICDSETGRCICQHNTGGENCERCAKGYYGNALGGTPYDCQPCGCPNGGACIQLDDYTVCTECPLGYTGRRCDSCSDGYYGDPLGRFGTPTPCTSCDCNLNIDPNAVGNCNTTTGECLKCIHNTGGSRCDQCLQGFYGDALALPKGDCQPCECYGAGTKEHHDGSALCDQISGECRCKQHVEGRNCDQCEPGFYNIISGEGCQSCNCNPVGSLNHTCDLYTGQCLCRPGITGPRCDRCEDYKYGFSTEGCKSCECDPIGSKGPQCDLTGQCPCLDNVEGRRCDRCKENKYDRQRGCVDCPDCYNLVQVESRQHLSKIARLNEILDEIERNPTVIDDDQFEHQLREIQAEVEDLLEKTKVGTGGDEESIADRLDTIRERQKEISRTLSEVEENIYLAREKGEEARLNLTYTEETLKRAETELNHAFDTLDKEGRAALEKASERAHEFGQQSDKMTNIAQEARQLADILDEKAEQITKTAGEAKNRSIEGYELAKNATDQQRNVSQDIKLLRNEILNTEGKLGQVKKWTEDVHDTATAVKSRALELLNDVNNLIIPEIDVPKLKAQVERIKEEAKQLLNDTERLLEKNDKLTADLGEQVLAADDLLTKGIEQNDITTDLLGDIDLAKARADNAVKLGQEILDEAHQTYETLSNFDKQVKDSKDAAQRALRQIPEIQQLIEEAVKKTQEAELSLLDAKTNADSALNTAITANDLAKNASQNAQTIRNDAEFLNQNASGLKHEAELMADRLDDTRNAFQLLLEQSENNETLIAEAKDKVGKAGKDSQEATKKVNEILRDVEAIVKELDGLPELDDDELNRLEDELIKAEHRVRDADLAGLLEQVKNEEKKQNELVTSYTIDLEHLRREVANIRDIANALPDGCFKRVQLEP